MHKQNRRFRNHLGGKILFLETLFSVVPVIALILAVLLSIFLGIATPSESGAVGVFGALLLGALNFVFDKILVAARKADRGVGQSEGAAYVFERNQGGAEAWDQTVKLAATDPNIGQAFGISVSRCTSYGKKAVGSAGGGQRESSRPQTHKCVKLSPPDSSRPMI